MKLQNSSVEQNQNKETEIISQTNQSKDQELINYNQINSSIEKTSISKQKITSTFSSTEIQQSKIEIEQKNIQMLIFQRSLYIMKQKFEQNRKENQIVYNKYKSSKIKSLECISTQNLFECYKEIFKTNNINLYPYENFNDLVTADLASSINEDKYNKMINELVQYTKKRVEKYNEKFYENKMKKKKLREEAEKKNITELEKNDVSDKVKIVHKNKRGEIISNFDKISETNKKVVIDELIYSFTEEDITILTSHKLLYHGVIPLIIADFIQEYMEKNIKIGIIITNKSFTHESEDLLLEKNIKVLYDAEIMKLYSSLNKIDPKEEKNEDLKRLLFESNSIDNKIKLYNELILENSKKGMDITYLMEMVKKLKEQKSLYQKKISEINIKKISSTYNMNSIIKEQYSRTINTNLKTPKKILSLKSDNIKINSNNNISIDKTSKVNKSIVNSNNSSKINFKLHRKKLTKEDIRKNALKEIFSYYSKQHSFLGRTPTFDDLLAREELMNLSEFLKFCDEFKIISLKKRTKNYEMKKIFISNIKDASLMTFDEFLKCLNIIASLIHREKKEKLEAEINLCDLKIKKIIEKENKKKNKKLKNSNSEMNNNEEEKNIEQNNSDNNIVEEGENKVNNINNENKIKENNEQKKENSENKNTEKKSNEERKENNKDNIENQNIEEDKKDNNEGNNNLNQDASNNKDNTKNKKKSKNKKLKSESKELLEAKKSKLQNELMILEQKTESQILEDFYIFLELDDTAKCGKKMIGYTRPFAVREDDTRNPKKNVKNPIKFNNQSIMRKYEYLLQRKDDIKKEKELNLIKEQDIKFEERKRKFNREIKKLEKDYDSKIKTDNYIQIRKNEEDYLKEKNSKLTWKYIQNSDYNAFLLNDEKNININTIPSQLKDIFSDKNSFNNDDENFINKLYSKNDFNKKKSSDKKNYIGDKENSRYEVNDSDSFL